MTKRIPIGITPEGKIVEIELEIDRTRILSPSREGMRAMDTARCPVLDRGQGQKSIYR